jgi:23S rRNA pseudouridine2605 synthase
VALQRLQKILAEAGVASRRKCEEIIAQGRVAVDGVIMKAMGVKADPDKSRIEVDGVRVKSERKAYCLLNKPSGILSTTADEFGRPTVMNLIPGEDRRLYPVGRLDEDTEGLIILTNDGELANILTHPRYGVPKTYSAKLRGIITVSAVARLLAGIRLDDGVAKAEDVKVTYRGETESYVRLVMREGRNHVVRRMLAKAGFPAKRLRRDRIAFLTMHDLKKGESRPLTRLEVAKLYEYATPGEKEPEKPPRPERRVRTRFFAPRKDVAARRASPRQARPRQRYKDHR